jgi:hypothetical protein
MYKARIACGIIGFIGIGLLAGCNGGGREGAHVSFTYVVEKEKGLPPGMNTIAITPAKVGPTTDPKWSEMCVTVVQSLINDSRGKLGTPVTVTERRDAKAVFDEGDLKAAGMATGKGGNTQLVGAEGLLLSNINVKEETHTGKQRTISGLDIAAFGGHHYGGGAGGVQTSEVETVTRNLTVQTEFKLVDAATGKVWEYYSPHTFQATDRTKASPLFGSSQTEAALTPKDRIIGALVEQGAREFVSMLMPCRVQVDAEVQASNNASCAEGVRQLRAENFREAVSAFQSALNENPNDHRAAYGAGIASEALGNGEQALNFYKQACAAQNDPEYMEARDRMKAYAGRIRKGS